MTVRPQKEIKLPVECPVPSLIEIETKMCNSYGDPSFFKPVIHHCAEIAERMMLQYLNGKLDIRRIRKRRYKSGQVRHNGYNCPRCSEDVRLTDKFCSGCGIEFEFFE